ncbi:MAG: T9SS type A sorting domain-containing protein, partial [Bacteroidia bacterium]
CVSTDSLACTMFNNIHNKEIGAEVLFYYSNESLQVKGSHKKMEIELFDTQGKLLLKKTIQKNESKITLPDIPEGIYLIKITTENQNRVIKIPITKN